MLDRPLFDFWLGIYRYFFAVMVPFVSIELPGAVWREALEAIFTEFWVGWSFFDKTILTVMLPFETVESPASIWIKAFLAKFAAFWIGARFTLRVKDFVSAIWFGLPMIARHRVLGAETPSFRPGYI